MESVFEANYHVVEKEHFWFKARRNYILRYLENFPRTIKILDIGCSSGILLGDLARMGFELQNLYGVDISSNAIQNAQKNGIVNAFEMDAKNIDLPQTFEVVIASDCLEHIDNDGEALLNWAKLLSPSGLIFVFVPAFMFLWSNHDVVNRHYRRYTLGELKIKMQRSGFRPLKSSYWNFALFFPAVAIRLFSKVLPLNRKNEEGDISSIPKINGLLETLMNVENKVLKHTVFPFGVSAFVIAQKAAIPSPSP